MVKCLWKTIALMFLCAILKGTNGQCQSKATCSECLQHVGCAWCKQKGFLTSEEPNGRRCDLVEALRRRNCSDTHIINPKPHVQNIRNEKLGNSSGTVVQLRPQKLHLKLRVGVPQSFDVVFKRAEGYPIDLYYLMDLSFSMRDDLANVQKLGRKIVGSLKKYTHAVRIGFGAFVDKVRGPFVNTVPKKLLHPCDKSAETCQPPFSFRHVLKLTDSLDEYEKTVSQQNISGNLDNPESGFDGVMQIAVCQDVIGWGDVTRILVYTSDDTFHMAGDGKLAGIIRPNDGKCHLNSRGNYDKAELYDYPSVGHLSEVLEDHHIKLIFAVTEKVVWNYEKLSEIIPQSVVGILSDDSSNVVQLITDAYNNLTSTLIFTHRKAPAGLDITYRTQCSDGSYSESQTHGECRNVGINEQVNLTVTLSSSVCLTGKKPFSLKVQGMNEELTVIVETICDCECNDTETQSPDCHGKGTSECGICSCDKGNLGQNCQCEVQQDINSLMALDAGCIQPNSTVMCSAYGSCICGHCVCRGQHRGKFCECDDTSCFYHNNLICGGNGRCNCGTCECQLNYSGLACECSTNTDNCQTGNGLCSHHGRCECNKCICNSGFAGKHCAEIPFSCNTYLACVQCLLSSEDEERQCAHHCASAKLIHPPNPQIFSCYAESVLFNVEIEQSNGTIFIYYQKKHSKILITLVIMGTGVTSVVILGITMILIYLVCWTAWTTSHCSTAQ